MAKLKNIIRQLSNEDFESIHQSLVESTAGKSAMLLQTIRETETADSEIMNRLEVNTNAFYTLRSRLNLKIEEYLLQQMETPRADVIKKVANINELVFTKKRTLAIATLKKLEKELLDYDLSNELTVVYKSLKKLHVNFPEFFTYSQLYNRHIAYMLAVDKAEDLLTEYFKNYGVYTLSGNETDKLGLTLVNKEMGAVSALYKSHRLYVYQSCMSIFHRLFVETEDDGYDQTLEPIEDILTRVEGIFKSYSLDSIYYHLQLVFEFLKLEYYSHFRVFSKAEMFMEDVNENCSALISHYSLYTFPAQFFNTKILRSVRMKTQDRLNEENEVIFQDFELEESDVPKFLNYGIYRSLSCFYAGKYDEASRWAYRLINDVSMKNFPYAQLEVKSVLALQYCLTNEYELFKQLLGSVQRQIRLLGKGNCEHIQAFSKILSISISDSKTMKESKIRDLIKIFMASPAQTIFCPTKLIHFDDALIKRLSK